MALNHFAAQIKENKAGQAGKLEHVKHKNDGSVHASNSIAQPKQMHTETEKRQTPIKLKTSAPDTTANQDQANTKAAMQSEVEINPALKEIPLTWSDQQMLCALSAMQVRYGRPAEAIPYLMMIRKINPNNVECTRLLALAFMRLNRWQEAEVMVEELDHIQKTNSGSVLSGVILLYRSLVCFKVNKLADAKSWFGKFRTFNKAA